MLDCRDRDCSLLTLDGLLHFFEERETASTVLEPWLMVNWSM